MTALPYIPTGSDVRGQHGLTLLPSTPRWRERPYRGEEAMPPNFEAQAAFAAAIGREEELLAEIEVSAESRQTDSFWDTYLGQAIPLPPVPGEAQRRLALDAITELTTLPKLSNNNAQRQLVTRVFKTLRGVYCTSSLGQTFPLPGGINGVWEKRIGKLLYAAFAIAYGEDLLTNKQVEEMAKKDLSRVGQLERLGLLQFVENPWVAHRMQRRRRVSIDMVREFLQEEQDRETARKGAKKSAKTTTSA